jgi:hypothetical protein
MNDDIKKIKCINNEGNEISLTVGKVYNVMSVEIGWYRIKDDSDEDYLFPPELFEIVK